MIEVGKEMRWHRYVTNYGFLNIVPVTVVKIGKRITVKVTKSTGETMLRVVKPESLHE